MLTSRNFTVDAPPYSLDVKESKAYLGFSPMKVPASVSVTSSHEGEILSLNSELWHACAGPLVSLPLVGSRVVYFPQGHSEQVAASTNKEVGGQIPNYPNLPPQLICQLHNVTLHADNETDEVYSQMTLQPVGGQEKEPFLIPDLGTQNRQPNNFFCKTLTASDTSTHGGFSIPRRAAEKVFPPLDFTQQPPAQELIARDLHDVEWKFRHIYRGQPKRHLLTTGWSVFVSAKRLTAGDAVLFIRNEKGHLLLGIRRANRLQTVMPSSFLSSDSMHIGVLAAAAHAAATNSRFTVFYNPRASPCEFVIPLSKYEKAVCHTRVSVGMRFRMLFETEESSVRRYMGTITSIGDLDEIRWPNSHWRTIKVGWDESTAGERQIRVSLWEIEPVTTFLVYPPSSNWRLKRPWPQTVGSTSSYGESDIENMKRSFMLMRGQNGDKGFQGLTSQAMGVNAWAPMQKKFDSGVFPMQSDLYDAMAAAALQEIRGNDPIKQLLSSQQQPVQSQQICRSQNQLQLQQQQQHLQQQQQQPQVSHPQSFLQQQQQHIPEQQQLQPHIIPPQLHHNSNHELLQQLMSSQQQLRQQQTVQLPSVVSTLTRPPSSQSLASTMPTSTHPSSNVSEPNPILTASTACHSSLARQAIFCNLASEENTLHSNLLPSTHNIQQSGLVAGSELHQDSNVSAAWFSSTHTTNHFNAAVQSEQMDIPRPTGGTCTLSMTDPTIISAIPAPSFPASPFFRDFPQDHGSLQSDPHNHLLFGVNIDATSFVMANSISNASKNFGTDIELQSHLVDNLLQGQSSVGTDVLNSDTVIHGCFDSSGFLQQVQSLGQINAPTRTFTKVYKLGSVGRSLDVTRFNNYTELRHELARMFGLEGQIEDPLRSGWQLVFVDKENDVLLVGDDPWEEFVSSVRCIKILSPPEVLQMTQERMELLSSIPTEWQTSSSSEDCATMHDSRNPSSGITSTCSLDY